MPLSGTCQGVTKWAIFYHPVLIPQSRYLSAPLFRRYLLINHTLTPRKPARCLILRRTNKNFGKGVDSFPTLPIMRLHTAGVISSAGRAPPLQGGGRRFDPVITHHFGSLAQLVEQLTFNQLVAGSNPARPTNVKRRPKGAFLLSVRQEDSNLPQVRVEPFMARHRSRLRRRPEGRAKRVILHDPPM